MWKGIPVTMGERVTRTHSEASQIHSNSLQCIPEPLDAFPTDSDRSYTFPSDSDAFRSVPGPSPVFPQSPGAAPSLGSPDTPCGTMAKPYSAVLDSLRIQTHFPPLPFLHRPTPTPSESSKHVKPPGPPIGARVRVLSDLSLWTSSHPTLLSVLSLLHHVHPLGLSCGLSSI